MDTASKVIALQRLLDQAQHLQVRDSDDATFKTWKNAVERALIRIFGEPSPEVGQFKKLRFYYDAVIMSIGADYSYQHRQCFDRDFQILTSSLRAYLEELHQNPAVAPISSPESQDRRVARVFISHASADLPVVEELVELLELIGLTHDQIFCTSFADYGIDPGQDFLSAIKSQLLNANALVLFVLTRRFYSSPMCLCEMGATWVLAKEHIPILVPPFEFTDVQGVIPLTQGFKINDRLKLNVFKDTIEAGFGLSARLSHSVWERRRDRVVSRINAKIAADVNA